MAAVTGISKCYYALVTADTADALTFGTPVYMPGVQSLDITPKVNNTRQYGENKIWRQKNKTEGADVAIALADLTSVQRAALLGSNTATEGGVYATSDDTSPDVAILYKATIDGGTRYGVIYKGQFMLPAESNKQEEGKTEFQVPALSAFFQPTINNGFWEYHVDSTDANFSISTDAAWFGAVIVPSADAVAPTVTCVPADAATEVVATDNIVLTFNKAMDVTTFTANNIFVIKADGTAVSAVISYDNTNKIVTVNPADALTAGAAYLAIATTGCKSATGVALAANNVFNFTIAE